MTDFKHEPLKRIREDVAGEGIFVRLWQELMQVPIEEPQFTIVRPATKLGEIMMYTPVEVTQRTASICAEFCRYLGTNGGRGYLQVLDEQLKIQRSRPQAAITAWAIENQRCYGTNGGARTIEFMLSPVWGETATNLSFDDIETVDVMANWLGTEEGRGFVAVGLRLIDDEYKQRRLSALEACWRIHHPDEVAPGLDAIAS